MIKQFFDFRFQKQGKLWPLFFSQSFRAVAVALLSLFSSVYVYKTILSLTDKVDLSLLAVFVFNLGLYFLKLFSNFLAEDLALKWGLKKQIWLGLTILAGCLLILSLSLHWPYWLFLAGPLWGLAAGFYWFGQHGLLIKIGRPQSFGKALGMAGGLATLLLVGTPFVGGLLINFGGYQALFAGGLFFVALAALILQPLKERKIHHNTDLLELVTLFKTHQRMFLAYWGDSAGVTIYGVVMPLYVFLILGKELSLGEFFSLSLILVALINLLIGRWVDLRGKRGILGWGAFVSFLVWLGRLLTRQIPVLLVFDILDRVTGGMTGIPLSVLSYEKALGGRSTGRALLFREVAIAMGSIFACLLLIVIALLNLPLQSSFLAAGFLSLLPLLIVKRRSDEAKEEHL
jgi:MFS family permease